MENSLATARLLVKEIELHLTSVQPDLVDYYKIFSDEALFARKWLDEDLHRLAKGSAILEVGAGLMILSAILVKEGWKVCALEPVGQGFSMFEKLQAVIYPYLISKSIAPEVVSLPIESFRKEHAFDFAFSVNVMEHIDDVELGIANVVNALKFKSAYRFTCANYHFPYETHFNIPTLFTKSLTEKVLGKIIFNSKRCKDPVGTWRSLNWITVTQIKKICKQLPVTVSFNKNILKSTLERAVTDKQFSARRSKVVIRLIHFLTFLKLHKATSIFPVELYPLLDCKIIKSSHQALGMDRYT